MSYWPVQCPHCHKDLPLRVCKAANPPAVKDLTVVWQTMRCRRCGEVVELTGKELRYKLAPVADQGQQY